MEKVKATIDKLAETIKPLSSFSAETHELEVGDLSPDFPIVQVKYRGKQRRVHPDLVDKKKKEWDKELVTGVFKFYEQRNGSLRIVKRAPYLGEKIEVFTLKDGETVTIPRYVARSLREGGRVPIHRHIYDEKGRLNQRIGEYVDRYDFFEINSYVDAQPKPSIVTVQKV